MALTDITLSQIAFKNLSGKSHTDNNKGLGNEAEGIFLNVAGSEVLLDEIDITPANAVSAGVALFVQADLVLDPTSNGHAYFAEWPNPLPVGTPAGISPGDRVRTAITPSFGDGYEAKPFDTGASAIPVNDPRDWIYQYNSGVFFQQDVVGSSPSTIDLYVYIGQRLSDIDFNNLATGSNNNEWQDSVKTIVNDSNISPSPLVGDRYLIIDEGSCGIGGTNSCLLNDFIGYGDYIAEWQGTNWTFTAPTDSMTVKVDNQDGYVYHYENTTTNFGWLKYSYGQVRVLNAIGANDYIATVSPPIDSYRTDMIFLTIFDSNNTDAATVNIDGLGAQNILKDNGGGTLVPLVVNDIRQGLIYFLTYNGSDFQLSTSIAEASTSGSAIGVIGPAEDGDYTDGLFTDFVPTTPTGTAIDRFNEVLKALAPPPAPSLTDWSGTITNDVTGKLSFDTSNPIFGYIGADTAPTTPISVDGTWTLGALSGKRLGIKPTTGDVTGVLNDQVIADGGSPNPAYPANSFGDADKGTITLSLNGVTVATINLTSTTSAIDTTSSGTVTGLSVSAENNVVFPSGDPLSLFKWRTGTWLIKAGDGNLTNGYNYVTAQHNTGTTIYNLSRFEFIIDDSTTATTYTNQIMTGLTLTGAVRMSGVEYNTGGTTTYSVDIDNAYRNTYSSSSSAISHVGTNCSAPSSALGANGGNEALQINHSATATISSNIRLIDGSISLNTTVDRTVQSDITGGSASTSGILLDNISTSSTEVGFEDFNAAETYRLKTNLNYDLIGNITTGAWDSDQSLLDGSVGHTDGLQVTEGKLIYPNNDYSTTTIINSPTFNDGGVGGSARDYTTATGTRKYLRYFKQTSPTTANFIINIAGSGGTFVDRGTALTGNNIHLRIKAPTETGWLDAYNDFSTGQFNDDDGARSATDGAGRAFNTNWGLTIGTKSTANSGGNIVVEITVGASFTGEITGITFTFN